MYGASALWVDKGLSLGVIPTPACSLRHAVAHPSEQHHWGRLGWTHRQPHVHSRDNSLMIRHSLTHVSRSVYDITLLRTGCSTLSTSRFPHTRCIGSRSATSGDYFAPLETVWFM
jgi:hypothetical protein